MLAASSSSSDEIVDGCPVVQLTDSPHDLAHLLSVLLPTSPIHYHMSKVDQPRTFEEVSAVIRLADKYHIKSVHDHALRVLQRYHFTSDFAAFSGPPDTEVSVEPIHAIGAVNLAHLTDTPRMLPLALYKCCCLDDETLLAGWTRADGTVEHLTPADLARCSTARPLLIALHVLSHPDLGDKLLLSPKCSYGLSHAWVSSVTKTDIRSALSGQLVGHDVFHGWARQLEVLLSGRCKECVGELMRRNWMECRRIWDALPEVFGVTVDGWKSVGAPRPGVE